MAISSFGRPDAPAANAVRARNDGAKPRLTNAKAPCFKKIRRDCIFDLHAPVAALFTSFVFL